MSTTIDERIVEMHFDSKDFENNVKDSMNLLERFNKALNSLKAPESFQTLGVAASHAGAGLSQIGENVEGISKKMQFFGEMGRQLARSLSIDLYGSAKRVLGIFTEIPKQVNVGFSKYAQVTSSVQTILAATKEQGETMESVSKVVEQLRWFTDETSYSLTDMTFNIGKFTSNGIKLKDATSQMQGIAVAAALSGSGIESASHAMEGFSKAMGKGKMDLSTWHLIQTAKMDTVQFKNVLIEAGEELGTLKKVGDGLYKTMGKNTVSVNNFTEGMKDGWMTAEVMQKALMKYGSFTDELYKATESTGLSASELLTALDDLQNGTLNIEQYAEDADVSAEELKKTLDVLNDSSLDLGKKSLKAAQEAKTFEEAIQAVKDAVSSKWMETFEIIFGNYEEAKKLWTGVANALYYVFAASGDVRNDILKTWKAAGGRTEMLKSFVNIANTLYKPFEAMKRGITSLLPDEEKMGEILADLTKKFAEFTEKLLPSEEVLKAFFLAFRSFGMLGKTVLKTIGFIAKALSPLLDPLQKVLHYMLIGIYYISAIVAAISEWLGEHQKVAAAILITLAAIYRFNSIVELAISAVALLSKALIVLKVVAIGGLIAAFALLGGLTILAFIENLKTIRDTIIDLVEKFKAFISVHHEITDAFSMAGEKVRTFFTSISEMATKFEEVTGLAEKFQNAFTFIGATVATLGEKIRDFAVSGVDKLIELFSNQSFVEGFRIVTGIIAGAIALKFGMTITAFMKFGKVVPAALKLSGAAIATFIPKIMEFIQSSALLSGVAGKITAAFALITGAFSNFSTGSINFDSIFATITAGVNRAVTNIKTFVNWIGTIGSTFGGKAFEGITKFIDAVKKSIDVAGTLKKGVSAHELETADGLKVVESSMSDMKDSTEGTVSIVDKLRGAFESIPQPIKDAGEAIKDFFSNIDSGQLIALGFTITMLLLIRAMSKFMHSSVSLMDSINTNLIQKGGAVLGSVKGVVDNVNGVVNKMKPVKEAKQTFKDFAEGVALIAGAVGALALLPAEDLIRSALILSGLMVIFSILYLAVTKVGNAMMKTDQEGLKGFVTSVGSMIGMAAAILVLVGALYALQGLTIDASIIPKLGILFALGVSMALIMNLLSDMPASKGVLAKALGLVLLAFALKSIVSAFNAFSENGLMDKDIKTIGMTLLSFVALVGAISLLSYAVGKIKLSSVLGLVILMKFLQNTMPELKQVMYDITDVVTSIGSTAFDAVKEFPGLASLFFTMVVIGLIALSHMFEKAAEMIGAIGISTVAIAAGVWIIMNAMESIKDLDWKQALQGGIAAVAIMGMFAVILLAASTLKLDKGGKGNKGQKLAMHIGATAIALSIAFGMIVGLMHIIGLLEHADWARATITIVAVMGMFAVILLAASKLKDANTKSLGKIIFGVVALIAELLVLTFIKWEKLVPATIALTVVLGALAAVIRSVAKMKPDAKPFWALIGVVVAIAALTASLWFLSQYDWKGIIAAGAGMMLAMIGLTGVLKAVSRGSGLGGRTTFLRKFVTLIGIGVMLVELGTALSLMADFNWASIAASGLAMMLALVGLKGVIKAISSGSGLGNKNTYTKKFVTMIGIGVMLVELGAALNIASRYDWKSIAASGFAMMLAFTTLSGVIRALSSSSGLGNTSTFAKKFASMIGIGLMLIELGAALNIASRSSDWSAIAAAGPAMAAALLGLTPVIKALSSSSGLGNMSTIGPKLLAMAGLGVMLIELGAALNIASRSSDWEAIAAAGPAMALALLGLVPVIKAFSSSSGLGNASTVGPKIAAMVGLGILLAALGVSLAMASNGKDWQSIAAAGPAMALALLGLVPVIQAISSGSGLGNASTYLKKIAMLMAVSVMLVALGGALALASMHPWQQILAAGVAMSLSLLALCVALGAISAVKLDIVELGKTILGIAALLASLFAISLILPSFAKGLEGFNDVEWGSIGKALVGIISVIASLTILGYVIMQLPISIAGIAVELLALWALSAILPGLADGFKAFTDLDWEAMGKAMIGLAGLIGTLALIGGIIGTLPISILGMAVEIAAIAIIAAILPMIANGLMSFQNIEWETIGKVAAFLGGLAVGLTALGAIVGFIVPIAIGIGVLVLAILAMAGALAIMAPNLQTIAGIDLMTVAGGLTAIAGAFALLGVAGVPLLIAALVMPIAAVGLLAISAAAGVAAGAITALGTAFATGVDMIAAAVQRLAVALYSLKAVFANSMTYAAQGMVVGLQTNASTISKSGVFMGLTLLDAFYKSVGQGSPWETIKKAMAWCAAGFAQGADDNSSAITKVGEFVGNLFTGGMLSKIQWGLGKVQGLLGKLDFSGGMDDIIGNMFGLNQTRAHSFSPWADEINKKFSFESIFKEGSFGDLLNVGDLDLLEEFNKTLEESQKALAGEGGAGGGGVAGAAGKAKDAIKDFHDSIASGLESKTGGMNFFKKLELNATTSAEAILENMKSNVDGVASWTARLGDLMKKGLDAGLVKTLADAGLDSYDQITAFLSMTDEQIQEANTLFQQAAAGRAYSANEVTNGFVECAKNSVDGLTKYLEGAGKDQAYEAGEVVGGDNGVLGGVKDKLEINSPSRKMWEVGIDFIQGMINGMDERSRNLFNKCTEIAKECVEIFDLVMDPKKSAGIGKNWTNGLIEGLEENAGELEAVAKKNAALMEKATMKETEEHSPSRVAWRIGKNWDLGLANGMADNAGAIEDASVDIAHLTINSIQKLSKSIGGYVEDAMSDIDPTIKPVLDTTELMKQAAQISSLFDGNEAQIKASVNGVSSSSTATGTNGSTSNGQATYNFTQNNYSPKALDRGEIYRRTNNQLSMLNAIRA